jgi:CheY-like chemotaxis protein
VHPLRVLLAEDNALNRTVASRMLERLGADVTVAEDGRRAAQLAADENFDLVLMDLQMPVLDGIGAAREIRADERSRCRPAVRLVALTGNVPDDYADACAAAGMDAFLVKPVDLQELRGILDAVRSGGGAAAAPTGEGAPAAESPGSTAGGVAP